MGTNRVCMFSYMYIYKYIFLLIIREFITDLRLKSRELAN